MPLQFLKIQHLLWLFLQQPETNPHKAGDINHTGIEPIIQSNKLSLYECDKFMHECLGVFQYTGEVFDYPIILQRLS